ncbi:NUDIX hydrolase [uncultured virus]|nr:NUDIX hydrolase [uncultured virus]
MQASEDRFNNVLVEVTTDQVCEDDVVTLVNNARNGGKNAIRFTIKGKGFHVMPLLLAQGAVIHHALGDYVLMDLWLSTSVANIIPGYNTSGIGIVASIRDEEGNFLLVKERFGAWANKYKHPTGTLQKGEFPVEGALREIKEELGVDVVYQHAFGVMAMKGQLYDSNHVNFYLSFALPRGQSLRLQESEITDARWFGLEELLAGGDDVHFLAKSWAQMEQQAAKLIVGVRKDASKYLWAF